MKSILAIFLAAMTLLAVSGCGGHESAESASIRVLHASPNAPNVDVLFDNDTVLTNVAYTAGATRSVDAGVRRVRVNATGTTTTVIDANVTLSRGTATTVLAVNNLANIEALVINDEDSGPGIGQTRLRLVHASPSTGNVDIYISGPTDALPATPTLANIPFKAVSNPLTVAAGSYRVRITPAGNRNVVAIDTGALALASNSVNLALALDSPGGGAPLIARVLTQQY